MPNQNPEQLACDKIDERLEALGHKIPEAENQPQDYANAKLAKSV